jgi:hypothetical protein
MIDGVLPWRVRKLTSWRTPLPYILVQTVESMSDMVASLQKPPDVAIVEPFKGQ